MEEFLHNKILNVCGVSDSKGNLVNCKKMPRHKRSERITIDGNLLSYQANEENSVGVYVGPRPLTPKNNYFEVEILDSSVLCSSPISFPNVIGCIDGCLIKIKKPTVNTQEFMCRKGYPAINVQYTCLPDHRFSSIVAKWPGSCHDSSIFNESSLSTYLANGNHGILLGDSGYPNRPYLLTPVLGQAEDRYNNAHCKTRVKIEQAFGIMKNRFVWNAGTALCIGLAPYKYSLDDLPGQRLFSIGYQTEDGKIYRAGEEGTAFGPKCLIGDRVGCGIKFDRSDVFPNPKLVKVFFTRNGKEIGTLPFPFLPGGFHPSVGFRHEGEIRLLLDVEWLINDIIQMAVDFSEDEWSRLHDVRLNGVVIEYAGRGKSILDVGLAQAKAPLDTTFHYFEIEIVDPGENCYIAIGVARKNYPPYRHPGWNRGSIAYHADDGKIFLGSGVGDPFGPKCHRGDVMGCGILFPTNYDTEMDSELMLNELNEEIVKCNDDYCDPDMSDDQGPLDSSSNVQVFFTRNGKLIGKRLTAIPKGGFYPTIGMLSSCERVRVDLRPLTG